MGLDTVELVMAFEEEFDIEIPNKAAEGIVPVRDVRDFVVAEYGRLGWPADADEICRRIVRITSEHASVEAEKIDLDTTFVGDLEWTDRKFGGKPIFRFLTRFRR